MRSGRTIVIAAIVVAILACAAIIAYFMTRAPSGNPLDALTRLELDAPIPTPTATPEAPSAPLPDTGIAPPAPAENEPLAAAAPPATVPPPAPARVEPPGEITPPEIRIVLPPRRLKPEGFVFTPIPFDAPLAEFPLVLVWQRNREAYLIRDFDLDGRLSPAEWAMLGRLRAGFFGVPESRPSIPSPERPSIPSTEESPSGL